MRRTSSVATPVAALVVVMLLAQTLALGIGAGAAPAPAPEVAPGNAAFQRTWARTDQPVVFGTVARTWMWGPDANTPVMQEDYAESPGGKRDVQYFDKSRMEITHPDAVDDGVWYVTNGLLVVEMMTGQMQVGDDSFVPRAPAMVNVAGDADDPTGPTYSTFAGLRDLPPLADGVTITQRVNRAGVVTSDPSLAAHGVTTAQRVTVPGIDHQIASPFWEFMNSSGVVHENGQDIEALLFQNPYYATGYPLTEAYWASVKIANTYRDVLMQCFERRCLTYTPGNPPGFVTEAGNVGQHYYTWRYQQADASSVVINEVLFWPEDGDPAWVELHNRADDAVDLTGWTLSNGSGSAVVALPAWQMPGGSFLVVSFGAGANDSDLTDGSGAFYTGALASPFFSVSDVALYAGQPGVDTIIDFVGWSYGDAPAAGAAYDHALTAGIWPPGEFFDAATGGTAGDPDGPPFPLLAAILPGDSIGRDQHATDTNTSSDWSGAGGVDADGPTPGAANLGESLFGDDEAAPESGPVGKQVTLPLDKKKWTVMVYFDGRDPQLLSQWRSEFVELQKAGSDADVNIVTQLTTGDGRSARHYIAPGGKQYFAIPYAEPGDPAALSAFVTWAKTNFPAEKYAIVLAGHGDGWKGVLMQGAGNDFLRMSELSTGLSALGEKFETVFFYACLMGMVEVGHQIEGQAKYMVASQQTMWTGFNWEAWLNGLKTNPDQDGGALADSAAQRIAAQYDAIVAAPAADPPDPEAAKLKTAMRSYGIASTTLATVTGSVSPAVAAFGQALLGDVPNYNEHDVITDNRQLIIKHGALGPVAKMQDRNFVDLHHLAQLVEGLPLDAAAAAGPVRAAVLAAVRWEKHGPDLTNARGLTIYFPRTLLLPNNPGSCGGNVTCDRDVAYAQPLWDPDDLTLTAVTHMYAKDPGILVPKLAFVDHSMRHDLGFHFPFATGWHTFLHRYYKPVADACIRKGDDCVTAVAVKVGETVTLSGNGSSDSDGPEGPMDDVPPERHFYWDFYTDEDHPAAKPQYLEDVRYVGCGEPTVPPIDTDEDDCDRDDIDANDDDRDAHGKVVEFTCEDVGFYPIRLMVWDEHHDQVRQSYEEFPHNDGRHWLHFNVDDDWVLVLCTYPDEPRKPIKKATESAQRGDTIEYLIAFTGNPDSAEPVELSLIDPLPAELFDGMLFPVVTLTCSLGLCGFNPVELVVFWEGEVGPGDMVMIEITVHVPPEGPPLPPEIVNCATVIDGTDSFEGCATTITGTPEEPSTSAPLFWMSERVFGQNIP